MKIILLDSISNAPKIDLLGGITQVFQGKPPSIETFLFKSDSFNCYLAPNDAQFFTSEYLEYIREFASDKHPILFFNRADRPRRLHIVNGYSIQNTYELKGCRNQIIVPYNIVPLEEIPKRDYFPRPQISFVGYINPHPYLATIKSIILSRGLQSFCSGPLIRAIGTKRIKELFPNSIIVKRSHYGGARSLISNLDQFRQEYIDSILYSDLVFTPRGDANSSQRYYEVISAGRMPIIPDSNMRFPKVINDNYIIDPPGIMTDWRVTNLKFCVDQFWSSLSTQSWQKTQDEIQHFYTSYYDYRSYMIKLFNTNNLEDLKRVTYSDH